MTRKLIIFSVIVHFFGGNDLLLQFHSNLQIESKGFSIVGRQLPCPSINPLRSHAEELHKSHYYPPYHAPSTIRPTTIAPIIPCDQDFILLQG